MRMKIHSDSCETAKVLLPNGVPFELLDMDYVKHYHQQTLEELNSRGGMTENEIFSALKYLSNARPLNELPRATKAALLAYIVNSYKDRPFSTNYKKLAKICKEGQKVLAWATGRDAIERPVAIHWHDDEFQINGFASYGINMHTDEKFMANCEFFSVRWVDVY